MFNPLYRREEKKMIFGKHINRYYLRFLHLNVLGLAALILVDYLQLIILKNGNK